MFDDIAQPLILSAQEEGVQVDYVCEQLRGSESIPSNVQYIGSILRQQSGQILLQSR